MKDYIVKTAVTLDTGFDDRECNHLMYGGMKEKIARDIRAVFLSDQTLSGNISSDLTLRFLDGYKVSVGYEFSCYDENEQEAESFSNYCVEGIESRLNELGYRIEGISCKADEMDMGWLDELEAMIFR